MTDETTIKPATFDQAVSANMVRDYRDTVRESDRREKAAAAEHRSWLKLRHAEVDWPIDSYTMAKAEYLDPEDVRASPPEEIDLEQYKIAAAAPDVAAVIDPNLQVFRRSQFQREMTAAERLRGQDWSHELVDARLIDAFRVLFRASASIGPRAYGSAMPTPVREMADLVAQAGNKSLRRAAGRLLRDSGPPRADEVRRMDDALGWASCYLRADHPELALFVNLGGMWKAWGASIASKCRDMGVHRQVFYKDRKRAIGIIVDGLRADGRAPI